MLPPASPCGADVSQALLPPNLPPRLGTLLGQVPDRPGCSPPQACQSWAATKAAYRFFDRPPTAVANLLPALVRPAVRRARGWREVLVPHDSTSFNYTHLSTATGLGFLNDSPTARGLHLHSSLLLD